MPPSHVGSLDLGMQPLARLWRSESRRRIETFRSPDGELSGVLLGEVFGASEPQLERGLDIGGEALAQALAALIARRGETFASALDGVFVLLVKIPGRLFVVRDAIGEHPLYVLEGDQGVVVSDRLTPLLEHPSCSRQLDAGGVADFLATGFCPFSRTPVAGVSKVLAGYCWTYDAAWQRREHQYHRVGRKVASASVGQARAWPPEPGAAALATRACLERAVDKRLPRGREVGLLLSGGLDSSLVGALVGGDRLQASYSLSFGKQYRNELEFSGLVAQHLGVPHRVVEVSARDVRRAFERTARTLDEPIGDPLTVPNVLVAERARQDVDVVFNGEGGDPLFGGPKNLPMLAAELYGGAQETGLGREHRYLASYNKGYETLTELLTPDFAAEVAERPLSAEQLAPYFELEPLPELLDRLMHINLRLKGASQILTKVYKVAGAVGLLARSPLFDRELVELAFSFPASYRLKGTVEKWVLKEAVRDLLPEVIIDRPKSGMLVPVHFWFLRQLRGFARDLLLSRRARGRGLFRVAEVERLLKYQGGGPRARHGDRIWLLLSLECWLAAHAL